MQHDGQTNSDVTIHSKFAEGSEEIVVVKLNGRFNPYSAGELEQKFNSLYTNGNY